MFQIDVEQFGDAADDCVPGGQIGSSGAGEDLLDAEIEPLLTQFEVFEQALAGERRSVVRGRQPDVT